MWGIIRKIELSYSLAKSAGEAGRLPRLPPWTLGLFKDRNVRV